VLGSAEYCAETSEARAWGGGATERPTLRWIVGLVTAACMGSGGWSLAASPPPGIVVLVSADLEWKAILPLVPGAKVRSSPFGEWFVHETGSARFARPVVFLHGGWGKIAAAGSAQYAIDRFKPRLLVNLGTCGGFRGAIEKGDIVLVERTVVYDIVEAMGDSAEAIAAYATEIDTAWAGRDLPPQVRRGPLVSADRDLRTDEVAALQETYGAVAGDWESGAVAWVAHRNGVPVVILRGVSDLVGAEGGEAYANISVFEAGARVVMKRLFDDLPAWLDRWESARARRPAGH
jgi:adenosylhomocysteine nucleosidase